MTTYARIGHQPAARPAPRGLRLRWAARQAWLMLMVCAVMVATIVALLTVADVLTQ